MWCDALVFLFSKALCDLNEKKKKRTCHDKDSKSMARQSSARLINNTARPKHPFHVKSKTHGPFEITCPSSKKDVILGGKNTHIWLLSFPKYDILQTSDFSVSSPEVATQMHFMHGKQTILRTHRQDL